MNTLMPHLLTDDQAALVIGFSKSWLRNTRYADKRRVENGEKPLAPEHIKVGRRIRYTPESLQAWLNEVIAGTHPICDETQALEDAQ